MNESANIPRKTACTKGEGWRAAGLAVVFVALGLLMLAAAGCGGDTSSEEVSAAAPEAAEETTFTSSDGVTLSGYVFGSGPRGVVLAHMYPADQTSWFSTAERLADEGYAVLTFDFRGYGTSTGEKHIDRIDGDLAAAVHELRAQGASSVALVGASMGGTAALRVAAEEQVACVVTLSAPVEFEGLSAREVLGDVGAPKLFIAADDDVGADDAEELSELALPPSDLALYPGDEHGTELLDGPHGDEVWERVRTFLDEHVRE